MVKLYSLTELCDLQVSVETISPRKGLCSASDVNALAIPSGTVVMQPGVLLVERLTSQGSAPPHSSSLSAATVEETTQPTTSAA